MLLSHDAALAQLKGLVSHNLQVRGHDRNSVAKMSKLIVKKLQPFVPSMQATDKLELVMFGFFSCLDLCAQHVSKVMEHKSPVLSLRSVRSR